MDQFPIPTRRSSAPAYYLGRRSVVYLDRFRAGSRGRQPRRIVGHENPTH